MYDQGSDASTDCESQLIHSRLCCCFVVVIIVGFFHCFLLLLLFQAWREYVEQQPTKNLKKDLAGPSLKVKEELADFMGNNIVFITLPYWVYSNGFEI